MSDSVNEAGDLMQPPIDPQSVWKALIDEPMVGVAIVDRARRILYANDQMCELFMGGSVGELGKRVDEVLPELVETHAAGVEFVAEAHKPLAVRHIWRGRQIWNILRPIPSEDGDREVERILITAREINMSEADIPDGIAQREGVVELGPFDVLTPRELEVFVLLGQGLIMKEIAAVLNCSPRTVEVHKRSIGAKLHESDRIRLARLAFESGLQLHDARRPRLHVDS